MKLRHILILDVILLFVVASIFGATHPKYRPTTAKLTDAYRIYNDKYFYGALPINKTKVVLSNLGDYMGRTIQNSDGTWTIIIDTDTHPLEKEAELTLIHEMCHQKIDLGINMPVGTTKDGAGRFEDHGPAHEACMLSVAKQGGLHDLW